MLLPRAGVQPCLVAPHGLGCVCALLDDGRVCVLTAPAPSRPPVLLQQLRFATDSPAVAIACSADGALLAVASRTALSLYTLAASEHHVGVTLQPAVKANLRWRVDLHSLTQGLDVASLAPGAIASAAYGVCAVGSGMGCHVLSNSPDAQGERQLLHPGLVVCGALLPVTDLRRPVSGACTHGPFFLCGEP